MAVMKKLQILLITLFTLTAFQAEAAKKAVLDAQIEEAISDFYELTSAGKKLAKKSEGMLVFPSVKKAGIGVGGEIGEGALLIDGDIVQYYRTISGSIGFQLGAQVKTQIILFMEDGALEGFRSSEGWEVGVDGSVALATLGAGGQIDTKTLNQPIIGFIFGNKGLMYNLTLEGSKLSKINKKK
jgi:lipid-binding SYLF domain-containing protein